MQPVSQPQLYLEGASASIEKHLVNQAEAFVILNTSVNFFTRT